MNSYIDRGLIKWMPFDALSGFSSLIHDLKKDLLLQPEKILTQDHYDLLNYTLLEATHENKEVTIIYYKYHHYIQSTGRIIQVDPHEKTILLSTKEKIAINHVILLEII
jgi:hypothetical protein